MLWFTPGSIPIAGYGGVALSAADLAALEAVAVAVSGHGGLGDRTDGVAGRLVGLVITVDPTIGSRDVITTGVGADIVLGGAGGDDITTNRGETASSQDGTGIVLADHGFVDWVLLDGDPTDLDRIWSTDPALGGVDTVTTGRSGDVVIGGNGGDTITASDGDNLVIGDNGRITAATPDSNRWGDLPMTLGRIETTDATVGGADTITSGIGMDVVLGGAAGDTITTNIGESTTRPDTVTIVIADHGFADWVVLDGDPADLDRVWSTDEERGGVDTVTTGRGDDIVIGGTAGDTISASDGWNIVLGDNGRFTADALESRQWGQLPMASGVLETVTPTIGGADTITTGSGIDVVLGGADGDTIRSGDAADVVLGDHGFVTWLVLSATGVPPALRVAHIEVTDNTIGGVDTIYGQGGEDVLAGGAAGDRIDGGTGRDLIFGDNVSLDRAATFGDHTSPRFRVLSGTQIYSTDLLTAGQALVTSTWQNDPAGPSAWSDFRITLLDHDVATQSANDNSFGADDIAGGAGDDTIFGQLGDDVIQGDGSIDVTVGAHRDADGYLVVAPSFEAATDGNDYIEAGGGADVVFGGLGQDDIIGGSSDLFSLETMDRRPDVGDLLFGGAGTDIARNDETPLHGRDSDTIVGDNGEILRLVTVGSGGSTTYRTFTYDTYGETVRLLPRAVVLLDYTPGGPDLHPELFPGTGQADSAGAGTGSTDVWGSDEVHGESGDDTVYVGGGNDVVYGDAGDDDVIGGWGHDWASGGTGTDGIIGDDGRIFTSRNGSTEPLNGVDGRQRPAGGLDPGQHPDRHALPLREAHQGRRPHPVRPQRCLRRPALRARLRQRRDLRRPRRRLPARCLRRRRGLGRGGAGHLVGRHVCRSHPRWRRRDRLEPAVQRRHPARLRPGERRLRPLRRVRAPPPHPARRRRLA